MVSCDFVIRGIFLGAYDPAGEKKNLGAYAQYTVADEKIAFKVPSSVSPAAASTIPLALTTAWLAMFSRKCLNMSRDSKQSILVWGGSCEYCRSDHIPLLTIDLKPVSDNSLYRLEPCTT